MTGVDKHLILDEKSYQWSNEIPLDSWTLSSDENEGLLNLLFHVSGLSLDLNPPKQFVESIRSIYPDGSIPWKHVLPRHVHQAFLKRLINDVRKAWDESTVKYFKEFWKPIESLHAGLQRAKISKKKLEDHKKADSNAIIDSFLPDEDGFARPIVYNRFASRTGRLGVKSGPMILNLKKSMRDVIESSYGENGSIVQLDFNALEARIILYEAGKSAINDLYSTVASEAMPNSQLLRSTAKACIISELYGISQKKLAEKLGVSTAEASRFMNAIRRYFATPQLIEKLRGIYDKEKCIYNKFGRRLFIPDDSASTLLNTYAQSTGADAAQLGFLNVVNDLRQTSNRVKPLFVLHDALILDVHDDDMKTIENIKEVTVPGYEQKFPLKCEKFYTSSTP